MNLIPINDRLKEIPFLYVENDSSLRDIDKDCIESVLGGFGAWADLEDYKIDYLFNAYSRQDTFEKISQADYILLNTSFTGASGDLFYNFILGAIKEKLKDKVIINCTPFSVISSLFNDLKSEIKQLDKEQNIKFFFPSSNMDAFVRVYNEEGFTLN